MTQDALFPMPVRRGKNGHPRVRCPGGCLFHALLPSMAYACGPYLTTPGHGVVVSRSLEAERVRLIKKGVRRGWTDHYAVVAKVRIK